MTAREWLDISLDAEERARQARTAALRRHYGQNAIDSLLAAASLGDAEALLQLGIHYQHGAFGILRPRPELAEHWLRLAAKVGHSMSMLALGTLLMKTGRETAGRRWLRKALAHGEGGAACHLGRLIEAQSPSRALRLYRKGAALGDPAAALFAGELLEAQGSRRALLEAEAMYKRSARRMNGSLKDLERVRLKLKAG